MTKTGTINPRELLHPSSRVYMKTHIPGHPRKIPTMCETGLQVRHIYHSRATKFAFIKNTFPTGRACVLQTLRQQAKLSHLPCKSRFFSNPACQLRGSYQTACWETLFCWDMLNFQPVMQSVWAGPIPPESCDNFMFFGCVIKDFLSSVCFTVLQGRSKD